MMTFASARAGTDSVASIRPLLAVAIAFFGVVLIVGCRHRRFGREGATLFVACCQFALVCSMIPAVRSGTVLTTDLGTFAPGVRFAFRADPLAMLFALVASGLWVVTTVYSVGYVRDTESTNRTRYYAALAVSIGGAVGVAFAENLLVLVLFYELMTIGTYPLVVHDQSETARRVGYQYLAYVIGGGTAALGGTAIVFSLVGSVSFTPGGIAGIESLSTTDPWPARIAFGLLAAGFGVKAAIMPLHAWLPNAMVAPTPVSGILHAVAVVKSGAFGIARTILEVFGPETANALGVTPVLAAVAAVTILLASLLALAQDNLKRRLAYSTIAQLSYIVLGVSLVPTPGIVGGLIHLPAHAVAKLTLFFCAGAIYIECGVEEISELAGVGHRMPLTIGAFAIGSLSLAGIPLFAGFVSKWHLVLGGGFEAPAVLFVLLCSSALSVAYLWPIVATAFFERPETADAKPVLMGPLGGQRANTRGERAPNGSGTPQPAIAPSDETFQNEQPQTGRETSPFLLYPTLITAALVVAIGVFPGELVVLELAVAAGSIGGG